MLSLLLTFLAPTVCAGLEAVAMTRPAQSQPARDPHVRRLLQGQFRWTVSRPLIGPASRPADPCRAIKDPSVVYHAGHWHVFCTIRSQKRTHQIEYLSFSDWNEADRAARHVLKVCDAYFCAPQIFYFAPQKKWYLLYQAADPSHHQPYGPAFSTAADVADPAAWTPTQWLEIRQPSAARAWLDFWVICDQTHAYLFFTSLDGKMWRMRTRLADFPAGWGEPAVALEGDVFEASHTYCLKGLGQYLTLIEAEDHTAANRRYFKAYLADRLDGRWAPLSDSREMPFAGLANTVDGDGHWTDSFSHGELLRDGVDQRMEVDPAHLRMLFQGVTDERRQGRPYGDIPWRLGLLEPAP